MSDIHGIARATGLLADERNELYALLSLYGPLMGRNSSLEDYYEGDVMIKDIGVDILPPEAHVNVDLSCDWPRKAVSAMSSLVKLDGFVFDGDEGGILRRSLDLHNFDAMFARYKVGVFKKGCAFACVNNSGTSASVTFHSADSACALTNPATGRLRSGFVIADSALTDWSRTKPVPVQVNLYMPGRRVMILRDDATHWHAVHVETPDGVMMMVALAYAPTDTKPLGQSRISHPVRDLVDDVLRVRFALAISTAFYAIPMRALLGLTDALYEALSEKPKWTTYINPMILATMDRQGHSPTPYQFPANSPEPLIKLIQNDAKQFSSATGVPLNSLGIVQDNPSSAEAILESRRDLIGEAQDIIDGQLSPALREIALLVMMVESNKARVADLDDVQRSVMPHFANPAIASLAAATDAAVKVASVNPAFAQTDVFFEMLGFDRQTIDRTMRQMRLGQARLELGAAQQPQGGGLTAFTAPATEAVEHAD